MLSPEKSSYASAKLQRGKTRKINTGYEDCIRQADTKAEHQCSLQPQKSHANGPAGGGQEQRREVSKERWFEIFVPTHY